MIHEVLLDQRCLSFLLARRLASSFLEGKVTSRSARLAGRLRLRSSTFSRKFMYQLVKISQDIDIGLTC